MFWLAFGNWLLFLFHEDQPQFRGAPTTVGFFEKGRTSPNLEEGSLFGDVAPPAKRLRIDSPEPESVDDVWAPLDETGDEFGRDVLLSAEDVELIAAL